MKNISSSYPLIVAPNKKNRNILECKCKSYTWYNLCSHTVAVACDTGISFDFFSEIKKKVNLEGKKRGLTKALEFDLTDKEKGMNQYEIAKKITREKRKKKHHLINHNLLLCVLILHQAFAHHQIQICSKLSTLLLTKMGSLHYRKVKIYQHNSHKYKNSSMLPYHYEIITLPNNVQKCYACGQRFADCYRIFANNLIFRHRNHRIMGMSITGQPIVNRDFQYTYYHLIYLLSIYLLSVCQLLTVDPRCRNIINSLDVIVQPTPV